MFSIQGFLTWQSKLLMTYKHLSQAERYQIHALMKAGHDQSQIAKLLDRHKSTISRELSRNTGSRGYRPKQACEMSADRAQNSRNANAVAPWVKDEVNALLRVQWSPKQIASQLPISHETVYQHVYADKAQGGTLWKNLRCQKQKRKRYAGGRERRGQIPNRRPLSDRPLHIEARCQVGSLGMRYRHWRQPQGCCCDDGRAHERVCRDSQGIQQNIRVGQLSHCGQAPASGCQGQDADL